MQEGGEGGRGGGGGRGEEEAICPADLLNEPNLLLHRIGDKLPLRWLYIANISPENWQWSKDIGNAIAWSGVPFPCDLAPIHCQFTAHQNLRFRAQKTTGTSLEKWTMATPMPNALASGTN